MVSNLSIASSKSLVVWFSKNTPVLPGITESNTPPLPYAITGLP